MAEQINIAGRLHSVETGNVVTGANEVKDDNFNEKQDVINARAALYVLKPNVAFAEQVTAQDSTYIVKTDFNVGTATIPDGCSLIFDGGKLSGTSLVLQHTFLDGDVKLSAGLAVSGTIANNVAKQSWIDNNDIDAWHTFIRNVVCENYEYTEGTYYPTTVLVADDRARISINGNNAKLIWTAPTSDVDTNISGGININKSFTNYSNFSVADAIPIRSHEITLGNGHGLSVGDTIVLMDTRANSFTEGFLNGEFLRVRTVNGNTIGLATKTFAQYPTTADTIGARVEQTRVSISNLTLEYMTDSSTENRLWHGLNVMNAEGTIHNVKVNGFHRALNAQYCYGIVVDACTLTPLQRASTDEAHYGLCLANCQKVNVCNCNITGGQHGLTTGGFGYYISSRNVFHIPCREIHITNNTIANEQASSWMAIGIHQNAEYGIISGNIVGGMSVAGGNMIVTGNLIRTCGNLGAVNITFPISYNFVISDNIFEKGTIMITQARISRTTYPNMYDDDVPECLVIANNTGNVYIRLQPSKGGATKKISAKVTNNHFNSWHNIPNFIKSDFDEIDCVGNSFFDNTKKGCLTVGSVGRLMIKDCHFESTQTGNYPVSLGGNAGFFGNDFSVEEIRIEGCTFRGANTLYRINQSANSGTVDFARLVVRGNYFFMNDTVMRAVQLNSDSSCKMFIFEDNFFEKQAGGNYVTGSCVTARLGRNKFLGAIGNSNTMNQNLTATTIDDSKGWSSYGLQTGTTAQRPTLTVKDRGYQYFDTSLSPIRPIWWSGSSWVDATGATV